MARRSTIGKNPLDAVIPTKVRGKVKPVLKKKPQPVPEEPAIVRERLSVLIPFDTVERVRNAAYWDRVPLARIVDDALNAAIDRYERSRGKEYPERDKDLRAGRPFKRK